jgi:hypothetical protein
MKSFSSSCRLRTGGALRKPLRAISIPTPERFNNRGKQRSMCHTRG